MTVACASRLSRSSHCGGIGERGGAALKRAFITDGIGYNHNLPQKAPEAFAQAVIDTDAEVQRRKRIPALGRRTLDSPS
jgi:hypothetical protein